MKNILKVFTLLLVLGTVSCDELKFGDKFLGDAPESSGATLDEMFSSFINSERVLNYAYTGLPYGLSIGDGSGNDKLNGHVLESLTDLNYTFGSDRFASLYYNGAMSSSTNETAQAYQFVGERDRRTIRYAWIYLENIDKVPDIDPQVKRRRIAEAKMLIALSYAEMLRYIGGVPWLDHAIDPSDEMSFPRITFSETVDRVVALLDEAAPDLVWKQNPNDDGRMTKAGALALKLRVLLFAASPTFNSSTPWHSEANEYTRYPNADPSRWERARKAGEEFMRELSLNGQYDLTQPVAQTHNARREAFRSAYYDRGGTEVLISVRRGYDSNTHEHFYGQRYYTSPTLNYVNMFGWEDGSDFPENFNWADPDRDPFFTVRDGQFIPTRDPRLYETVCVPGDVYFNGSYPPYYREHPDFRVGGNGGFFMMKFILQNGVFRENRPVQWPMLRLPEVLLSYAEAINEVNNGPNSIAYDCINRVRVRVGLAPIPTGLGRDGFKEALLKERAMEFGLEEVRWFDLIRWGRAEDFRKPLYFLDVRIKTGTINNPETYYFTPSRLPSRYWATNWDTKWYLSPIPLSEINKGYGMTQNPGW